MGGTIPVILYLVMSQEYYQKYNDSLKKIAKLVLRMSNWVFSINDFNTETLSKLSSQIKDILDKQTEPEYLEMSAILKLPKLEREILLVTLKEHRNGGITLQNLAEQVRVNQKTVLEKAEELIRKGILRKFEDNDQTIIDSLWVV